MCPGSVTDRHDAEKCSREVACALEFVTCNLCGGNNAPAYCRVGRFSIVRCEDCGLLYTNPRPPARDIAGIYSEGYFVSDNPSEVGYDDYSTHSKGLKQVFSEHLDVIEELVCPPASIVDIGCAFGYFLETAKSRGWSAEGVELSAYASQVAMENALVTVHTGTISDAGLASSAYDVATMWDMLEHSPDPAKDLAETSRILKPGGYLFLTVPDAGSLIARMMGPHWYGFKSAAEHNYFFSRDVLSQMLSRAGFNFLWARRGAWPCSMGFLVTKLAPYSVTASRLAGKIVRSLRIEKTIIKFRFIDMFVAARKNSGAPVAGA